MSERPTSVQPNAGLARYTGLKVVIAVLSLASVVTAFALIKMTADRDTANRRDQQLQEQARPHVEESKWTQFDTVHEGMTVEEVEAIMGPGERVVGRDGLERVQWKQAINGSTLTHYVSVKGGTVSSKGTELR
jgi:hypothetical protein